MEIKTEQKNSEKSYKSFFNKIKEQNGLDDVWEKVLEMLEETASSFENEWLLKFFCIYFSLLDDGNTCICLDEKILFEKWNQKWSGLALVSENNKTEEEKIRDEEEASEIIKNGIKLINEGKCNFIGGIHEENKLFVVKQIEDKKWLFANKYYKAKIVIEERIKKLFPENSKNYENTETAGKTSEYDFLADEQKQIIEKGIEENLLITGGPGTGKTTAVFYLLWKLFSEIDSEKTPYLDYSLYLAAPSGKAKDRLKESISSALNKLSPEIKIDKKNKFIIEKLSDAKAYTIHSLLNYNPLKNMFNFNGENQFNKKSIFVIDEASMIDIMLFKNLLEAIPEGARIFILGDKDQLPSVQAGAVFEELVTKRKDSLVELKKSHRFESSSQAGYLKESIQKDSSFPENKENWKEYGTWLTSIEDFNFSYLKNNQFEKPVEAKNPVFFYETQKEELSEILKKWSRAFCENFVSSCKFKNRDEAIEKMRSLSKLSDEAKILCAERQGARGVEEINLSIKKAVLKNQKIKPDDDGFYLGEPLILTKNLKIFDLYNGDTGLVVGFENSSTKYLMVEKKSSESDEKNLKNNEDLFFRLGDFMFYSLSLLPKSAIETSYAITIHKSQGSGFNNIMVILPEKPGHPLLTRQIFYTAVTRTQGNTYVLASIKALNHAKKTVLKRDTMLEL